MVKDLIESDFVGWLDLVEHDPHNNSIGEVIGWGPRDESYPSELEIELKKVEVELQPRTVCGIHYGESIICANGVRPEDNLSLVSTIFNCSCKINMHICYFANKKFSQRLRKPHFINFSQILEHR